MKKRASGLPPAGLLLLLGLFAVVSNAQKSATKVISNKNTGGVLNVVLRELKAQCYSDIDSAFYGPECKASPMARENCALRCAAPECYDKAYGGDPLEEGEIDTMRGRQYRVCSRELAKNS